MANLIMESFQVQEQVIDIVSFKNLISGCFNQSKFTAGGRDGHRYLTLKSHRNDYVNLISGNTSSGLYMGFRSYVNKNSNRGSYYIFVEVGNDQKKVRIYFKPGQVKVTGSDWLNILSDNAYIEIGMNENYFELRVNNIVFFRETNISGSPTTMGIGSLNIYSSGGTELTMMDFNINDASGTTNNSFLGDVFIDTFPVNENGSLSTGFNSNSGVPLFEAVNNLDDITTDWVEASVVGSQVTFNIADVKEGNNPLCVKIAAYANKMAGSETSLKLLTKSGEQIETYEKLILPVGAPFITEKILDQAPGGLEWDLANLNALEIGVEVVA